MRMGVLDIGSTTVHLLVVDAHRGARPWPAYKHKTYLRLVELLDSEGRITPEGAAQLVECCLGAVRAAEDKGVSSMLAFATSALREAGNAAEVVAEVEEKTGVEVQILAGAEEARLTFLAARRWYGWSSGRLLSLDIGGGSLELACGVDEDPALAMSVPLGAARLTRDWLTADPPEAGELRELRRYVRATLAELVPAVKRSGPPDHVVASSKTFRSLARITGAAPSSEGPYVRRSLRRADMGALVERLGAMTVAERATLPGVSAARAGQLLAGAVVADAVLDLFDVTAADICPWALREGVILRRLDQLDERESFSDRPLTLGE